ncbi:MAG: hypothetical protein KA586_09520 [Candidatus Promineofilum sp.]|nr:hypothetical protein [Promineifilum sp.]
MIRRRNAGWQAAANAAKMRSELPGYRPLRGVVVELTILLSLTLERPIPDAMGTL